MAAAGRINRVLVGADPSPGARVALDWALTLATSCEAEVVIVHARGLLEARDDAHHREAPAWLDTLLARIEPDVRVALRVVDGPPPEALLRASADVAADLIVVGRRGAGSPFELTLGSTSREVSSRATVPVLVVPEG